jgi:hypothetical protein
MHLLVACMGAQPLLVDACLPSIHMILAVGQPACSLPCCATPTTTAIGAPC